MCNIWWKRGSRMQKITVPVLKKTLKLFRKMLVGMGVLSRAELAGERMEVALASRDQEDEAFLLF